MAIIAKPFETNQTLAALVKQNHELTERVGQLVQHVNILFQQNTELQATNQMLAEQNREAIDLIRQHQHSVQVLQNEVDQLQNSNIKIIKSFAFGLISGIGSVLSALYFK